MEILGYVYIKVLIIQNDLRLKAYKTKIFGMILVCIISINVKLWMNKVNIILNDR